MKKAKVKVVKKSRSGQKKRPLTNIKARLNTHIKTNALGEKREKGWA